jgi:hypothetical protein
MEIPLLDDADDVGRVMTGFYWDVGAFGAPWPTSVLSRARTAPSPRNAVMIPLIAAGSPAAGGMPLHL